MTALPLSLRTKVALAMATVAALVVTAILATNFHLRRVQLLQEFQAFVRGTAGTTALALDGDEINLFVRLTTPVRRPFRKRKPFSIVPDG